MKCLRNIEASHDTISGVCFVMGLLIIYNHTNTVYIMGALVHPFMNDAEEYEGTLTVAEMVDISPERFHRPSCQPALNTKYSFLDLQNTHETVPTFKNPEDLIKAYYGLLRKPPTWMVITAAVAP